MGVLGAAVGVGLVLTGLGHQAPLGAPISPSQPQVLPEGPGASHCSTGRLFNAL